MYIPIALANASQVIVGYLMGAKRQAEVTNRVWHSMLLAIAISVGLATFFILPVILYYPYLPRIQKSYR